MFVFIGKLKGYLGKVKDPFFLFLWLGFFFYIAKVMWRGNERKLADVAIDGEVMVEINEAGQ